MSLEEIDNLIKTMEGSIKEIKNYQVIYKELNTLQNNITQSVNDLKANKDALDNLNQGITTSVQNLKKQVEELNTLLPQKMLEIVASNKDIQLDIKTKHEELVKISNNNREKVSECMQTFQDKTETKHRELLEISNSNTDKISGFMKKLSITSLILTIIIAIVFILNIIDFVTKYTH